WVMADDAAGKLAVSDKESHGGQRAVTISANSSIEQKVDSLPAGAYLARCWVKSESGQYVTFQLMDPQQPWAAYTCTELRVPKGQWVQIETFCALDRAGGLSLTLGGRSKQFHLYHGTGQDMASLIVADDFELVRYEAKNSSEGARLSVWDSK